MPPIDWEQLITMENEMDKTRPPDEATLENMLAKYRDMKTELAYPLEQLATLEKAIREHVKETGETADIEGARITVTPPKKARVYWDTKALEGLLVTNPALGKLRTEKMSAPAVRIIVD